jgi:hypothetical protein
MGKQTAKDLKNEKRTSHRLVVTLQIKNHTIKTFADIFSGRRFPKTFIVEDLGIGNPRMSKLILNPGSLTLDDCIAFGEYFDVPAARISLLGLNQLAKKKPR